MKLLINVPEESYKLLQTKDNLSCAECIIANGKPYDKVIDEVTELIENEWGYEGIRGDVVRIMEGVIDNEKGTN